MKSKANQIRTCLLIFINEENKRNAKKNSFTNRNKAKTAYIDLLDFKIEFEESYSSSAWCVPKSSHSTANNSTVNDIDNDNDNDNCTGLICQTRRRSIKLLHSICSLIKPLEENRRIF